jgi:hypothetical protein
MRLFTSVLVLGTVGLPFAAAAQDFPTRRAGLWEVTINHDGGAAPQTMQHCTDAETDKLMNAFGGGISAELCSKQDVRKVGATLVVNATCKIGPMTATSESVISGDFNNRYSVKVTSKVEGLPAAAKNLPGAGKDLGGTTTIEARFVGACKPDQKPGDIVMAGGKTMNIRDLQKMMGGQKGGAPK